MPISAVRTNRAAVYHGDGGAASRKRIGESTVDVLEVWEREACCDAKVVEESSSSQELNEAVCGPPR